MGASEGRLYRCSVSVDGPSPCVVFYQTVSTQHRLLMLHTPPNATTASEKSYIAVRLQCKKYRIDGILKKVTMVIYKSGWVYSFTSVIDDCTVLHEK